MGEKRQENEIKEIIEELKSEETKNTEPAKREFRFPAKVIFVFTVFLLFIFSIVYNSRVVAEMNRPLEVSDEEKLESMGNYLYLTNSKIEQYKEKKGKLPQDINELMIEDTLLRYAKVNDSIFELECMYDGLRLKYVSTEDAEILLSDSMVNALNNKGGNYE